MRHLQLAWILVCVGCGGAEFTAIDTATRVDAGDVLEDAIAPAADAGDVVRVVDPRREASADPGPHDAGDVDADQVDAGELVDAAEHDAGDEDHHLMMMCTASECPACPALEKPCCNTATLACGCYGPGITCR